MSTRTRTRPAAGTPARPLEVTNLRVVERADCPRPLPSSSAARALLEGEPGAVLRVASMVLGRAVIIGVGMKVARPRRKVRKIAKDALAGSAAIQALVTLHEGAELRRRRRGG